MFVKFITVSLDCALKSTSPHFEKAFFPKIYNKIHLIYIAATIHPPVTDLEWVSR